jgi:NAD(P)-dependent dehydrogenase (short-subunit alcohol dehydrogenase family)
VTISLAGQTVIVTGGAVRVGRAIALECARAGASVAITYNRSHDEAQQTLEELQQLNPNGKFVALLLEVSNAQSVADFHKRVLEELGDVTSLVNSAAIFRRTPFAEMTEADFDDHIATNLKGPYLLCKAFGDHFLQQQRGAIVNIADIHGLRPLKNYVPYCVSKAGVVMLTQALAKALAPHVRVNCICPGTILLPSETQGNDDEYSDDETHLRSRVPLGRFGTPEEIAQSVVFLIGGPQFISGAILPVDGAELLR